MNAVVIAALVKPIIVGTYGASGYVDAFVPYLAKRIADEDWDSRGREYMVMLACWDWFSGGGTADQAAKKIEAALTAPDRDDAA